MKRAQPLLPACDGFGRQCDSYSVHEFRGIRNLVHNLSLCLLSTISQTSKIPSNNHIKNLGLIEATAFAGAVVASPFEWSLLGERSD